MLSFANGDELLLSGGGVEIRNPGFVAGHGDECRGGGGAHVDGLFEAFSIDRENAAAGTNGEFRIPNHACREVSFGRNGDDHVPLGGVEIALGADVVGQIVEDAMLVVDDDIAVDKNGRTDARVVAVGGNGGHVVEVDAGEGESGDFEAVFERRVFKTGSAHREDSRTGSEVFHRFFRLAQTFMALGGHFVEIGRTAVEHHGVGRLFAEIDDDVGHEGVGHEGSGAREVDAEIFAEIGEGKQTFATVELDNAHLHEVVADDAVDAELLGQTALFPTHGFEMTKGDVAEFERIEHHEVGLHELSVGVMAFLHGTSFEAESLSKRIAHAARCAGVDEKRAGMAVHLYLGDEFAVGIAIGDGGTEATGICLANAEKKQQREKN